MKILHVSSHLPYPPDNGASADIWVPLQAMHRLGYTIDSVVIAQKAKPEDRHVSELPRQLSGSPLRRGTNEFERRA